MARSETTQRALVALVGVPVALAAVYLGGWALGALLGLLSVLGALEFYRMAAHKGAHPLVFLGSILAAVLVALAAARPEAGPIAAGGAGMVVLLAVPAVLLTVIWANGVEGDPLLSASTTMFGAVYVGGLLAFGLFLRHLPGVVSAWHGTALVFAPVLLTWASDTFAYFVGRAMGRRKLIPSVSPGKTVEGCLGALAGTLLVSVAYAAFVLERFPTYRLELWEAALFGLAVSAVAQVGDLAESLLKRDAGVKDSGALFPGHGGVLDRMDSLLFTLPLAYMVFFPMGPDLLPMSGLMLP